MRILFAAIAIVSFMIATSSQARDLALIVDQQNYRYLKDLPKDRGLSQFEQTLLNAGFEVELLRDASIGALRAAVFATDTAAEAEAGRVIIFVRGHVVTDGTDNWLISSESRVPDRFDVGSKALSLSLFERTLGHAAGRSLLLVAPSSRPLDGLDGLSVGASTLQPGQGVTAMLGRSSDLRSAVDGLLNEGTTITDVAERLSDLQVTGFMPRSIPFSVADAPGAPAQDLGEVAYWSAVRDIGTKDAIDAYLNRYPNGIFADEARRTIVAQVTDRETQLKEAEANMRLSRNARRAIQRDLALLGFNPRGIDGVFGPSTRRAVAAWQTDQGLEPHGYLDRDQRGLMQEAALRRAAALEEEARRRREIEEAQDRAFWQDSGSRRTESGYRAYLDKFPDGLYSGIARDELNAIEAERRAEMDARERIAWDAARNQNTIESYNRFLSEYPGGVFAEAAQTRISELGSEVRDAELRAKYIGVEKSVAGSGAARLLIEGRLAALGLDPGEADGKFTRQTRKALRRFQRVRNLEPTGYVDQATMVQLLLGR